ncbi:hypothetical protein PoB_006842400 [Plakobranchus ocellatus]|uniref:Uncharacterized protein n=1 Tax=Plakobranchus ocellatus TaxID=259542 RepID=A0AAV4DCI1_9GAST|nr:hypothetical protein PoB_006842400 [Plakobranchus ocellatus]
MTGSKSKKRKKRRAVISWPNGLDLGTSVTVHKKVISYQAFRPSVRPERRADEEGRGFPWFVSSRLSTVLLISGHLSLAQPGCRAGLETVIKIFLDI